VVLDERDATARAAIGSFVCLRNRSALTAQGRNIRLLGMINWDFQLEELPNRRGHKLQFLEAFFANHAQ
jgi:hypothetical protein